MIVAISCLISEKFEKITGIKTCSLKPYNRLDLPVDTHADMLMCVIETNVYCYREYYEQNLEAFESIKDLGYNVITINKECGSMYPNDVALNALVVGKKIFCNIKCIAEEIIAFAKQSGYKIIDVKQGYSACSTFVVNEKQVITADSGMQKALESEDIKVLLISSAGIKLSGYNCGFIGGSGFAYNNNAYFFGNIKAHPSYNKIKNLFDESNVNIVELSSNDLYDYGGAKLFFLKSDIYS